jgi:hypothetical protein
LAIKAPLQERETAAAEVDSTAKLRLMRQDAAAKGAQLETLLSANRGRLETMLGCRGRGEIRTSALGSRNAAFNQ